MKKCLLLIVALFYSVITFAEDLSLVSGTCQVFTEQQEANFELDLNDARFEKKEDFKVWCGNNFEERVQLMEVAFPSTFNELSKGLKISKNNNSKYIIKIHVSNFVRKLGNFGGARAWIKIYGSVEVYEKATNDLKCKIKVEGLGGKQDFNETERFGKVMNKLAEKIIKISQSK